MSDSPIVGEKQIRLSAGRVDRLSHLAERHQIGEDQIIERALDILFLLIDLSTTKVRPAVVVSSSLYHETEPDLLLAALTSRVATAIEPFDYVLSDWRDARLRFASALQRCSLRSILPG